MILFTITIRAITKAVNKYRNHRKEMISIGILKKKRSNTNNKLDKTIASA
jgi:hypothetical protein